MPSTMIHLLLAQKAEPQAPTDFFIGNIAPDAIVLRKNHHYKDKDILHFRDSNSRLKDIENLASSLNMSSPYCRGYIMHLFLDLHWDKDCLEPFMQKYNGTEWVIPYREEISKASSWLYHNNAEMQRLWERMVSYKENIDTEIQGIKYDEVVNYFQSNYKWYIKYKSRQSEAYPNDFVEKYTDKIAEKYIKWQNS